MGDVLMSSVVFKPLREKFPNAELHFLITENYRQVVQHHEYIDKLIFFEDNFFKNLKKLRQESYNIIVDAYSSTATAILCRLSGSKKQVGFYKDYTSFLYSDPVPRRPASDPLMTTAIEHRLQLLEPLGIELRRYKPEIFITPNELENARLLLKKYGVNGNQKIAIISTFGSSADKSYPYMARVLEIIAEHSAAQILCNYLPSQIADFQNLYASLSEMAKLKVVKDFDTRNLRELIAVMQLCSANIGNEGGSTNISKALGIPTFSIFAPFITKNGWNWFEDGQQNSAVHIEDYPDAEQNYAGFVPKLFEHQLINFVKQHL